MAERSFTCQVEALRLGAGAEFRGEGIHAVTKALLQSGVAYVGGYQGSPVSHLMDVLADAQPLLEELGVYFEPSTSEATAAAMLAASIHYPLRGAVTWKSTVGTNVASDALANLASAGVTGGVLLVLGEDYGEGSSIMQERTHAFAMKSQMWLLDPRPTLPAIVRAVEQGFELSEASHTPVLLMLRVRACHVYGRFIASANRPPPLTARAALAAPAHDPRRIILPPATFDQEQAKIRERLPAAQRFIVERGLNETCPGTVPHIGIILQGGLHNSVLRALELLGCADAFGHSAVPMHVLNVTWPLVADEIRRFCAGRRAVLVVEEGQPEFIEQALCRVLSGMECPPQLVGKGPLPAAGEYTTEILRAGIREFLHSHAPELLAGAGALPAASTLAPEQRERLAALVPARPSGLCTGCPERPLFAALKLLQRERGPLHISADIGCHSFATLPPFSLGASIMGYGLGTASAAAFGGAGPGRTVAVMGDGGFWHNGLTSGIGNSVFNRHDVLTIIVDNNYSAATGGQDLPSSRHAAPQRDANHPIAAAVRGVGVRWIRRADPYDISATLATLRTALTASQRGPKVIVAAGECQLSRQRRVRPQFERARASRQRVVRARFGVDPDLCTGDRSCVRLSGCPALTVREPDDPLRTDPVTTVTDDCVGCGVCGEIAHAAVLCPSFYQLGVVHNPTRYERWLARVRGALIGVLQRRSVRRRRRRDV
ncbi:MAG: indolepyruvate ferredoxin oxidoreductase subunit alpha [Gammaproteobacteria bacterium]|nr:indolepyruvate ferredoxin oxidoreductase subunit alpha [Gammaproteobacteria bacterium]